MARLVTAGAPAAWRRWARAMTAAVLGVVVAEPWLAGSPGVQQVPVRVTVDASRTYQTVGGWGASLSFIRDLNFVAQPTLEQVIEEAVNDLGLTFLRIGFGYLSEPFNDNANPREIDWERFRDKASIDREGARGLVAFAGKVRANGESPVLLLNREWEDPPAWMSNAEFAEAVAATILYYKNQLGLDVTFTSIDNEPMHYDAFTPDRQRAMIKVMGPAFESFGLATKIAVNEGIDARSTWDYISEMQGDRSVWPFVGLLNWHLYGDNDPYRSQIRDFGKARGIPTAQTEYHAQIKDFIEDLTLGGVSYWTRYHLADRGAGSSGNSSGNFFAMHLDGTSFTRNVEYWRFRQFMRYVRPGFVRMEAVSANPDVRAFAFGRAAERVVVIANGLAEPTAVRVDGLTPDRYGVSYAAGPGYKELGVKTVSASGTLDVTIPAHGVLTVYRYRGVNQAPILTGWQAGPGFLTLPVTTVGLGAMAQDVELDPLTFSWSVSRQPEGAAAVVARPAAADTQATGLTRPGEYVFTVAVRDTAGATASRDVTVRVYAGNQPPVIAEGHRYFKDGWMVQPQSTNTYGPLFISAFDLDGDPVTTRFSVVSQPPGGKAQFEGAKVSGLTVPGTYTFRFTASDPSQSVSRDFQQIVVPRREAR
jgi:O-glycosyl hydrolase